MMGVTSGGLLQSEMCRVHKPVEPEPDYTGVGKVA